MGFKSDTRVKERKEYNADNATMLKLCIISNVNISSYGQRYVAVIMKALATIQSICYIYGSEAYWLPRGIDSSRFVMTPDWDACYKEKPEYIHTACCYTFLVDIQYEDIMHLFYNMNSFFRIFTVREDFFSACNIFLYLMESGKSCSIYESNRHMPFNRWDLANAVAKMHLFIQNCELNEYRIVRQSILRELPIRLHNCILHDAIIGEMYKKQESEFSSWDNVRIEHVRDIRYDGKKLPVFIVYCNPSYCHAKVVTYYPYICIVDETDENMKYMTYFTNCRADRVGFQQVIRGMTGCSQKYSNMVIDEAVMLAYKRSFEW